MILRLSVKKGNGKICKFVLQFVVQHFLNFLFELSTKSTHFLEKCYKRASIIQKFETRDKYFEIRVHVHVLIKVTYKLSDGKKDCQILKSQILFSDLKTENGYSFGLQVSFLRGMEKSFINFFKEKWKEINKSKPLITNALLWVKYSALKSRSVAEKLINFISYF